MDQLHRLSIGVGWPHRAEDWEFLRQVGHGFAAVDEIDRVVGSAMWFPCGSALATIGMLITHPRLQVQGTAQWLIDHVLSECAGWNLRVNTPLDVRRFFRTLDFQPDRTIYQCQGIVGADADRFEDQASDLRPLHATDLQAVIALDRDAFGGDRANMLEHLMAVATVFGLFEDGALVGFSFCRTFGRGVVIGPVVAATDQQAITLTIPHLRDHANSFVRLDTPFNAGRFAEFLRDANLSVNGSVVSMSRPAAETAGVANRTARTYGLASHTLG